MCVYTECVHACVNERERERASEWDLLKHLLAFAQRHFVCDGAATPLEDKRRERRY